MTKSAENCLDQLIDVFNRHGVWIDAAAAKRYLGEIRCGRQVRAHSCRCLRDGMQPAVESVHAIIGPFIFCRDSLYTSVIRACDWCCITHVPIAKYRH